MTLFHSLNLIENMMTMCIGKVVRVVHSDLPRIIIKVPGIIEFVVIKMFHWNDMLTFPGRNDAV